MFVLLGVALLASMLDVKMVSADPCNRYSSTDDDSYWYEFVISPRAMHFCLLKLSCVSPLCCQGCYWSLQRV